MDERGTPAPSTAFRRLRTDKSADEAEGDR